jgi:transposase
MKNKGNYSLEVRERAIRMVREQRDQYSSEWAAINSIADKFGCRGETLRLWIRQDERDSGQRPGQTSDENEELKRLKRENFELKRANEILRKASAFFAQAELDREPK